MESETSKNDEGEEYVECSILQARRKGPEAAVHTTRLHITTFNSNKAVVKMDFKNAFSSVCMIRNVAIFLLLATFDCKRPIGAGVLRLLRHLAARLAPRFSDR
ncbi:hypothetical protein EMCRGX_G011060 [Ephydatia muelleri]